MTECRVCHSDLAQSGAVAWRQSALVEREEIGLYVNRKFVPEHFGERPIVVNAAVVSCTTCGEEIPDA